MPLRICQSSLLALVIVIVAAPVSSSLLAAPQEGVFKRSEEKTSSPTESSSAETETTATTSVTRQSTAQIDQQSDGWFTIVDDDSMVELRMPGKPTYKEVTFSPIAGRPAVVNHIYNTLTGDRKISVDYSWMDLHEAPQGKQLINALDGAVKGAVVNVFGELSEVKKIRSGKIPGREFDFSFPVQTPDGQTHMLTGHSRIFIRGNRQYQMNVIAPLGDEDAAMNSKLFDSLIIKGDK